MVSEASFSFGTTSRRSILGADERVGEADLLDDPVLAVVGHAVAETHRLRDRDQQAGDEVAERPLRREADDHAEHGGRGEQPAGDRPHLRDDEQRREEADDENRRPSRCAAGCGSASPIPARACGATGASRRARATSETTTKTAAAMSRRCQKDIRPFSFDGGGRILTRVSRRAAAAAGRRSRPRACASSSISSSPSFQQRSTVSPRRSAGKSTRPSSMSFTSTPSCRDLVDRVRELACLTLDLGCGLRELGRRDAAAVAADVPFELLLPRLRLDVGAAMSDHLLDERAGRPRALRSPPRG